MNPCILFRREDYLDDVEVESAREHLPVYFTRNEVPEGSIVIGRYSVLPFYHELEKDLNLRKSTLINTYRQHQFIADIREWTEILGDLTPKTYHRLQDIPTNSGPLIVKGMTNSKKVQWDTHMFAKDKSAAIAVAGRLMDDSLFANQDIVAREYVPLKLAEPDSYGFNGLPITVEHRFFVLNGSIVASGYYWSSHIGDLKVVPSTADVPHDFLMKAIGKIRAHANFFVLDVGLTEEGKWIVIEINDGQMSGLSECKSKDLYQGIKKFNKKG